MSIRIAYIISQYPEFYETFVSREVEALRHHKGDFRIFSLKTPKLEIQKLYPAHTHLLEYSPFLLSISVVRANVSEVLRNPLNYLNALIWLLAAYVLQPNELFKALMSFPKTVLFASRIRGRFDLLHAHWATIPTSMAIVIHILTGIRFSMTAHAWDIYLSPPSLLKKKIAMASGLVTCTEYNKTYLKSVCQPEDLQKIHRNYHGLDFATFSQRTNDKNSNPLRVIAVGRLVEQKGFVYLIRALAILAAEGRYVQATIVGEGPLDAQLVNEAASLPDTVNLELTGRLSHQETMARIAESNLFVAPSIISSDGDRDGIPNVILEAMAWGLPVVGTAVSGIPEVVINGATGILVPQGDAAALAAAIATIYDAPEELQVLGLNARHFVEEHFDVSRNVDELLNLLEQFAIGEEL